MGQIAGREGVSKVEDEFTLRHFYDIYQVQDDTYEGYWRRRDAEEDERVRQKLA